MTKQFCDICDEQIYGDNKMLININCMEPREFDVCAKCRKEFLSNRIDADIATYNKIRSGKIG